MIEYKGNVKYAGATFAETEHFWLDGMLEVMADSWDIEKHEIVSEQVGYYGSDCRNMCECSWDIDITTDVARDMIRTYKMKAYADYAKFVADEKKRPVKGRHCEVIRGRKVKKGTRVTVFWIGERPTYKARTCSWVHETETICGCHDEAGNKLWIKAEYLKVLDVIKSPSAKDRDKYVKAYIRRNVPSNVIRVARG